MLRYAISIRFFKSSSEASHWILRSPLKLEITYILDSIIYGREFQEFLSYIFK